MAVVEQIVDYDPAATDIDRNIGTPGYVGITTRGAFSPNTVINDARQRWLFRWCIARAAAGEDGALLAQPLRDGLQQDRGRRRHRRDATRMMAAKPSEDPGRRARARSSCSAQHALGNFRDLLIEVAKDPAMLVWLDGRTNVEGEAAGELRARADGAVHDRRRALRRDRRLRGGARVHRLEPARRPAPAARRRPTTRSSTTPRQHDTTAKDFSFPIYPDGSKTHSARARRQRACRTASI